jgi:hypothetical protein
LGSPTFSTFVIALWVVNLGRGCCACAGPGEAQTAWGGPRPPRGVYGGAVLIWAFDGGVSRACRWADEDDDEEESPKVQSKRSAKNQPPLQGKRKGWVPREVADFGDGGAFPEIHAAQYPLDMGRKDGGSTKTVALQMDAEGNIKYDAILHQGRNHKTLIQVMPTYACARSALTHRTLRTHARWHARIQRCTHEHTHTTMHA